MGGRGSSSGAGGGGGGFGALNRQYQKTAGERTNWTQSTGSNIGSLDGVYQAGYDANGNPQLVKWQGQDDDKAARYLAKVHNTDLSQYDDNGYPYYEGDYQKFSLATGLNDKPQVVSDRTFDKLVQQNNLQVLYRGESGDAACDRFMNADNSHTGVGSYGDGFYFTENASTANLYASSKGGSNGRVMKMALSPNARIITHGQLQQEMAKAGIKLQSALTKQGKSAMGSGYWNSGEAQYALKLGYNVISDCSYTGSQYHFALTRDAFIVSDKVKHHW